MISIPSSFLSSIFCLLILSAFSLFELPVPRPVQANIHEILRVREELRDDFSQTRQHYMNSQSMLRETVPLLDLQQQADNILEPQASSSAVASVSSSSSQPSLRTLQLHGNHRRQLSASEHLASGGFHARSASSSAVHYPVEISFIGCPQMDFDIPVTIGGNQTFSLLFDTGSTTLAVATSTCGANYCPGVTAFYTPEGSAVSLSPPAAVVSTYADQSGWTGRVISDFVNLGNAGQSVAVRTSLATIDNTTRFFSTQACSGAPAPSPNQGIIGFAGPQLAVFDTNNSPPQWTTDAWFNNFISGTRQAANPPVNLFTIRMCLLEGQLWLGGYDATTFSDQLHWLQLQPWSSSSGRTFAPGELWYVVALKSISILSFTDANPVDYNLNVSAPIIDSGTTQAIIPHTAYLQVIAALNSNAYFLEAFNLNDATAFISGSICVQPSINGAIPSSAELNARLPTWKFTFGGTANNKDLIVELNAVNSYLLQTYDVNGNLIYCSGIADNSPLAGQIILGWTFINQLVIVHDLQNMKIGLAPRYNCANGNDISQGSKNVTGGEVAIRDATGANGQSIVAPPTAAPTTTTTTTTTTAAPITTSVPIVDSSTSTSDVVRSTVFIVVVAAGGGVIILLLLAVIVLLRQRAIRKIDERTLQSLEIAHTF